MVLERQRDFSLIWLRLFDGEKEKERREEEKKKKEKERRDEEENPGLELMFGTLVWHCLEFMFGLLVWNYHKSLFV